MTHWRDFDFVRDPFDIREAEKMSEDMLQAVFVEHPNYRDIILDYDHSSVLLAAPGSGKTAHRIIFTRTLQSDSDNAENRPNNPLVVNYTDFSGIDRQAPSVSIHNHTKHLLAAIASAIFKSYIIKRPTHFLSLHNEERRWWWCFLKARLNLAIELTDPTLTVLVADLWHTRGLASFPDLASPLQKLRIAIDRIVALGFDKIYVVVDGADSYQGAHSKDCLDALFRELFDTTSLYSLPNVVWKFFLPDSLAPLLEESSGFKTGRLKRLCISWDPEHLVKLLTFRLAWASNGRVDDVSRLLDEEANVVKFDLGTELASLALKQQKLGIVQAVVLMAKELLASLPKDQDSPAPLISLDNWKEFLAHILKSPWFESKVQPHVHTSTPPSKELLCLLLEESQQRKGKYFKIRVLTSPNGESHVEGNLPFDVEMIPVILKALRKAMSLDVEFSEQQQKALLDLKYWEGSALATNFLSSLGYDLYDSLFADEQILEALIYAQALAGNEGEVTLQLHFDGEATALASIPWELMRRRQKPHPILLQRKQRLQLTRYINYPAPTTPLVSPLPLRMLYACSRPNDLPMTDSAESQAIEQELRNLEGEGLLKIATIPHTSIDALKENMSDFKPHILHFDGHGRFARQCPHCLEFYQPYLTECESCQKGLLSPQGYLALENSDSQKAHWVDGNKLGLYMSEELMLAVLSTCDSGTVRGETIFGGVGPAMIQIGIPAVLANQLPISVNAAKEFMRGFYHSLASYDSLPRSVSAGRRNLAGRSEEWFIPVLYLRSRDDEGYLFRKP